MGQAAPPEAAVRRARAARRVAPIAVLAVAAVFTACGDRRLGWGVVLWASQPGIGGAVLSISDESDIRDVYRYAEADATGELARWRVRLFADREQAAEFAAAFSGLVDTFGYAARSGLPVREAADAGARQLYRLREGEAVKIVARQAEPVTVGSYTNFWYQVLTSDGTQGFTFGEFLPLFDTEGDPQAEADRLSREDSPWDRIAAAAWRPRYYADMLASGRVDLRRVTAGYGFTIQPSGQPLGQPPDEAASAGADPADGAGGTARLRLPDADLTFAYDRVDRVGDDVFVLQGGGVRIVAESDRSIAVSFRYRDRPRTERFVVLATPVEDLIAAEQARRDRIYEALRAGGPALRSDAYGEVLLEPERRFRWSGFQRLVPDVVPADAPGTGTVELHLHLPAALRAEYAGVLTLAFDRGDRSGPPARIPFLYARDDTGMRLVPAGGVDDDRLLVTGAATAPLVIYFRFAE